MPTSADFFAGDEWLGTLLRYGEPNPQVLSSTTEERFRASVAQLLCEYGAAASTPAGGPPRAPKHLAEYVYAWRDGRLRICEWGEWVP